MTCARLHDAGKRRQFIDSGHGQLLITLLLILMKSFGLDAAVDVDGGSRRRVRVCPLSRRGRVRRRLDRRAEAAGHLADRSQRDRRKRNRPGRYQKGRGDRRRCRRPGRRYSVRKWRQRRSVSVMMTREWWGWRLGDAGGELVPRRGSHDGGTDRVGSRRRVDGTAEPTSLVRLYVMTLLVLLLEVIVVTRRRLVRRTASNGLLVSGPVRRHHAKRRRSSGRNRRPFRRVVVHGRSSRTRSHHAAGRPASPLTTARGGTEQRQRRGWANADEPYCPTGTPTRTRDCRGRPRAARRRSRSRSSSETTGQLQLVGVRYHRSSNALSRLARLPVPRRLLPVTRWCHWCQYSTAEHELERRRLVKMSGRVADSSNNSKVRLSSFTACSDDSESYKPGTRGWPSDVITTPPNSC